ncbi:hypothetical protein MVEN_01144600 [Mycena venus]|uniref:Transcription factor domain-containing protein n=1 Tax=Mycena venus TaxID=2733690 RepID=A0A8H7CVH7_9AGAR|nr:hypothetical protein MVEN_01144600 [Mycena venus]
MSSASATIAGAMSIFAHSTWSYCTIGQPNGRKDEYLAIEPGCSVLPEVPVIQTAMEEPPQSVVEILIDAFFGRFSDGGFFFLEPLQLRQSALLPLPFGRPERPSPALLSAVYLWGTRISSKSSPPEFEYTEEDLLALTVHNLAHDIHLSRRMVHNTKFLVQTIQAEVLLSLWYLNAGEPLPGRYHCAAASSLAGALAPSFSHFVSMGEGSSSRTDGAEFAERDKALLAVIVLDKMWLAASVLPSNPSALQMEDSQTSSHTIPSTIMHAYWGQVPFGLLATASLLFERSVILSTEPTDRQSLVEFSTLCHQLDAFQHCLPSMESSERALPASQILLVTYLLANVASIRLHAPHIPIADWDYADPILGVCNFYIWHYHLGPNPQIVASLETLLSVLSTLSKLSPMIHQCYAATQIYWSAVMEEE